MSHAFDSDTIWLSITNVALGVAVLVCLFLVGRNALREILARTAHRFHGLARHLDRFNLESLGITMSDGGEQINEMNLKRNPEELDDPPNIFRSEN